MNNLIDVLRSGKQRGYDEIRPIESTNYLFQYAIKKEDGVYATYFLKIDESKYDVFEDYAEEKITTFSTLEDALDHMRKEGADVRKLTGVKGVLPF